MMDKKKLQEEEYQFPYHYIPKLDEFSSHLVWKWGYQYVATINFLLEKLIKTNFLDGLDIGCGDGRLVRELTLSFPDKKIKGIDISQSAINLARTLNPHIEFEVQDIIMECKVKEKYDVIFLIEVVEHIEPNVLKEFISNSIDHLRVGGHIFLTTPSTNKKISKKHFQHFTMNGLVDLLGPKIDILENHYLHNIDKRFSWLLTILYNKYYILNYKPLLNWIFSYYCKNYFEDNSGNGHRLYIKGIKLED
jgi:2-polyprenyl-3-methyl-5-hydroxy-6-metoxy-1,4-benzoquinol methylase